MAVKIFRKLQTTDKELNLLQDHLRETLDSLTDNPWAGGRLVAHVALVAGSNIVNHGLGRNYVSWAWLRPSAAMTLNETLSPDPSQFIAITASAPGTVDLYVL